MTDEPTLFDDPTTTDSELAAAEGDEKKSRGAVLIETVIVISLILLFLFGIAELGMVLRSQHGLAEASRAGARAAAALPRDSGFDEAAANAVRAAVKEAVPEGSLETLVIYRADPNTGDPVSGDLDSCTECFRYSWNETTDDWDQIGASTWDAATQWACGEYDQTDFVGVYIKGTHSFVTAFWADDLRIASTTMMRLEPVTGTSICAPTSNPPPTAQPTNTPTPGPTGTPTATPTATPSPTPWPTGVPSPTPTLTPTPTSTPTPTLTPTPTNTPTPTPTSMGPTATPTATPSPTPDWLSEWDPDVYWGFDGSTYWYYWNQGWNLPSILPPGCVYYGKAWGRYWVGCDTYYAP